MSTLRKFKRSKRISVCVDVDVDLSEIDIDDLIEYVEDEGYVVSEKITEEIPDFETPQKQIAFLKKVMGLKPWHTKERLIKEIEELF